MLPESRAGGTDDLARFADTAVPGLLRRVLGLGALRVRLEVFLVGGAAMFAFGDGASAVGRRNEAGVRAALDASRLRVDASCTGGTQGRTVRVDVGTGTVTVKAAGGQPMTLAPGFHGEAIR
jgi:chemotaxis protein CheD